MNSARRGSNQYVGETRDHTDGQDPVLLLDRIASTPSVISPMAAALVPGAVVPRPSAACFCRCAGKRRSQILFQTLDALAHRAVGDVHFLCGVREIQVPGSTLRRSGTSRAEEVRGACGDDSCTKPLTRKPSMAIVASAFHHLDSWRLAP